MSFDNTPSRLESSFIQRDEYNRWYEQINITGSDLIIYHDENGKITADRISVWAAKYGIGGGITPGGSYDISASWASSSIWALFATQSIFATQSLFSTQSLYSTQSLFATQSLYATTSINASSSISSSWASSSISSSYSFTASYALNGGTGTGTGNATQSLFSTQSLYSTQSLFATSSISSSFLAFNGNRAIKRNDPYFQGINVGGNNVNDFLDNFFFPFVPSIVSITSPSSTTYYETGSVQTITVTSAITANDEVTFGSGSVKRDSLLWNTVASIPPFSFTYTDTNISSSHVYQTFVQVDNDGSPTVISSVTRTVSFIFPYLWGMSSTPGLSGNTLYTTMVSHSITVSGNKAGYFWGTGTYIYFAYPSSYSALTSILDPNNFEMISSFEYSASVPVTSSGLTNTWMNTYKVYRLKLLANPQGYFQFIQ